MARLDDDARNQRASIIAKQFHGIYPVYEAFYIHSIIYAADRSETAFERFDGAVAASMAAAPIFAAVQEALTHAGALSRFFWPVKRDNQLAAARGKRLREGFALDEQSPLKWRKLRNAFEHFDEDLDRFLLEDRAGYCFPSPMVDDQVVAEEAVGHIFKLVDPKRGVCIILGEKFDFVPIRKEVQRILSRALEMAERGDRL
jgi:hypothetical protein